MCENCGSEVAEGMAYCGTCGKPIDTLSIKWRKWRSQGAYIALLGIIALVVGILLMSVTSTGVRFWGYDDNGDPVLLPYVEHPYTGLGLLALLGAFALMVAGGASYVYYGEKIHRHQRKDSGPT